MVDSIKQSGLKGIQAGLVQAAKYAENISTGYQPNGDGEIVDDIVGLKQAEHQVKASAKVVKVGADLDQEVLDILA